MHKTLKINTYHLLRVVVHHTRAIVRHLAIVLVQLLECESVLAMATRATPHCDTCPVARPTRATRRDCHLFDNPTDH